MTRLQITKDFIIKTIIPILFAILLYSMFINLCTDSAGTVDYMKLFILCGINMYYNSFNLYILSLSLRLSYNSYDLYFFSLVCLTLSQ